MAGYDAIADWYEHDFLSRWTGRDPLRRGWRADPDDPGRARGHRGYRPGGSPAGARPSSVSAMKNSSCAWGGWANRVSVASSSPRPPRWSARQIRVPVTVPTVDPQVRTRRGAPAAAGVPAVDLLMGTAKLGTTSPVPWPRSGAPLRRYRRPQLADRYQLGRVRPAEPPQEGQDAAVAS